MVAVMLTTTLVAMNRQSLLFTSGANDRLAAVEMAQSGLNRALDRIDKKAAFLGNVDYQDDEHRRGYTIHLVATNPGPDDSVNNLLSDVPVGDVPPHTALIVVNAHSGTVTKRVRALVKRSLFPVGKPVSASDEEIEMHGQFHLEGIKAPLDHSPVKAGLHSNLPGKAGNNLFSVRSGPNVDVTVADTSVISAVEPVNGAEAFSDEVRSDLATQPDALQKGVPPVQLARTDVDSAVTTAAGTALVMQSSGLPAIVNITQDTYIDAQTLAAETGVLNLMNDSTLFVKGDLRAGLIRGRGAVVATGDIDVHQGTKLLFGNAATSLVAKGDIHLTSPGYHTIMPTTPAAVAAIDSIKNKLDKPIDQVTETDAAQVSDLLETLHTIASDSDTRGTLGELAHTLDILTGGADPDGELQLLVGNTTTANEAMKQFIDLNGLAELDGETFTRGRFQGLVYAQGNISVGGAFQVMGGLESRAKIWLGIPTPPTQNDTVLTYCESYRNLCPPSLGTPYVVSYQEE